MSIAPIPTIGAANEELRDYAQTRWLEVAGKARVDTSAFPRFGTHDERVG